MESITIEKGIIENFLSKLPEKLFQLGIRIVLAVLILLMGVQLIRFIRNILKKALIRSRIDDSAVRFIDSFSKYALYFLLIIMTASWMGVDAASIVALLGSAGVAIGLAVQGSFSNFAGGVLLLILKPFSVGDFIKDGLGNEGTVKTIDVFYTQLVTPDNKTIVLPNGTLANGCITNYSDCKVRRMDIPVSIAYDADIKTAKQVLQQVLDQEQGIQGNGEQKVFVDALADSGVNLVVRCWALQEDYWEVKWRLVENIKYALDDAGIQIPFPQMDVHMK